MATIKWQVTKDDYQTTKIAGFKESAMYYADKSPLGSAAAGLDVLTVI